MSAMKRPLKAILLFLPEVVICAYIFIQPKSLITFMLLVGKYIFSSCPPCLDSNQFLLSSLLILICLLAHLMRFLFFQLAGNSILADYQPSAQEAVVSLLVVAAYAVFLTSSLNSTPATIEKISIGIVDVVGASVTALALIVILLFVFSILNEGEIK